MHELVVRLNGVNAAFAPQGRGRHGPRASTSVSLFLFKDDRRLLHVLLDVGPDIPRVIEADDLFPPAFPLDWVVFGHSHADHCLGLDALCGDRHWWHKLRGEETPPIRVCCLPTTWSDVVDGHFPFQAKYLAHTAAAPGQPATLWQDDEARLQVTFLEVAHYRQSAASIFTFEKGNEAARVVCLFDFVDFHPAESGQAQAGGRADHPLFQQPDLLIAEATLWGDPRVTVNRPVGHIHFEKLAQYIARWQPRATRIVHYAGFEDMWSTGGPEQYRRLVAEGVRLHPRQGPVARWELTVALQRHMRELGYARPATMAAGEHLETMLVFPTDG
ncbi:MAG: MBL fold metallo-hydrolase [Gemmataceae bacterium]